MLQCICILSTTVVGTRHIYYTHFVTPIGIFISFFVIHVGKERINGSKHLQLLTGLNFTIYLIEKHTSMSIR